MRTKNTPSSSRRHPGILSVLSTISEEKQSLHHFSTAANYRSTMLSVSSFTGGKDIPMCGITRNWVESYEHFLQGRGVVRNTSSFYMRSLSKYNMYLVRMGRKMNLTHHLTSYCSRHTWASACRDSGIPLSAISSSLGHTSEKTTQIYLSQMDCGVLDRENERMLKKLREKCLSL